MQSTPRGMQFTKALASRASVTIKFIDCKSDSASTWAISKFRRRWPKPTMPGEYSAIRVLGAFIINGFVARAHEQLKHGIGHTHHIGKPQSPAPNSAQ